MSDTWLRSVTLSDMVADVSDEEKVNYNPKQRVFRSNLYTPIDMVSFFSLASGSLHNR